MVEFNDALLKSGVLIEALTYIRRFHGATFVIKYGGNAISDSDEKDALVSFAKDVVTLSSVGIRVVVVHGGGPQIGEMLGRLGIASQFVGGLRVTDSATLEVARMVLLGKINPEIVGAINQLAPVAVGLSGGDAGLINVSAAGGDLGFVGQVESVDPQLLLKLLNEGLIPVVATVALDDSGQAYNINADTVAGAIAGALRAEKLIYLTNVEGIYSNYPDLSSLIRRTDSVELAKLLGSPSIADGMIPKLKSCLGALEVGVGSAHILDGRLEHSLLLEIFTDYGIGTMVVK
ncbi:acetylglutamate kinase [Acidithrix ferrooxidans]|uniref:Acetylglutamate kinase n=1 Tax=Acidithrix ferrooxidans TaxID=1280514 RepID=A0A0D8HHM4_9ACTN|nr:acetylglutamate kinase [Acidithrix ferrooxidans]KJF16581.1 acetylglutamate kinase [Acidithrix ferrooxidans]